MITYREKSPNSKLFTALSFRVPMYGGPSRETFRIDPSDTNKSELSMLVLRRAAKLYNEVTLRNFAMDIFMMKRNTFRIHIIRSLNQHS